MDLTIQPAFLAEMSTLLILLAGAVLLFSSFREKYLLPWIGGWTGLFLAKVWLAVDPGHVSRLWSAMSIVTFMVALGLLVSAVLLYVSQRKLVLTVAVLLAVSTALALTYLLWLHHPPVRWTAQTLCWAAKIIASVQLVRFAWGRRTVGRWLLAVMFLLVHLDVEQNQHRLMAYDFMVDLFLGIGMMTVVLEDARVQIQRLDALNTITHQISDARSFESSIGVVLEELRRITRAKAAWFRVLHGERLLLAGQCGLSAGFIERASTIEPDAGVSGYAMREGEVYVLRRMEAMNHLRDVIAAEGIHHLLLVPVRGKNSSIGMFVLGVAHFRAYTGREKKFLKAAAKQIGLAAENSTLLRKVVQSRNEWASTFDSIPDCILVHEIGRASCRERV